MATVGQGPREHEGPEDGGETQQSEINPRARVAPLAGAVEPVGEQSERHHRAEEARRLEEAPVRAVEVDAHVAARERPREQRWEKRPHAACAGQPGAGADVHEEAHERVRRAVACGAHDDRPAGRAGSVSGERIGVSFSRDLERYAGLFASRTRVMKSSAMRDLMAITARPEVISLAGGLPDTSTFPPESFAAATRRIAEESCARALQYGPTEGLDETKACIVEAMAAEGMRVDGDDLIVTTGGQQVIDLVTKVLIDPGDVVIAEGPTYPGAVPVFSSYEADVVQIDMDSEGMRIDLLESTSTASSATGEGRSSSTPFRPSRTRPE